MIDLIADFGAAFVSTRVGVSSSSKRRAHTHTLLCALRRVATTRSAERKRAIAQDSAQEVPPSRGFVSFAVRAQLNAKTRGKNN